jgi:hypothetical protein
MPDADLDIMPGGVISGRVTDADGNPVADEPVELTYASDHWHGD